MVTITQTATEELLETESAFAIGLVLEARPTPLGRYMQFRAYAELVRLFEQRGELPPGFDAGFDLTGWTEGRTSAGYIREKVQTLLQQMKDASSQTLSDLCAFYCEHKKFLKGACKVGNLMVTISGLAGFAAFHSALVILAAGLGIATPAVLVILAFLIQEGVLDEVCECA